MFDNNDKKQEISDWYYKYGDSIFKFILMMIRDYQLAEDLTHETFIKAYKYHHSFQNRSTPRTWLFSIAHNTTVDYIRRRKPVAIFKNLFQLKQDLTIQPEEILELRESSRELYKALSNLKDSYREVIILRKIKGFTISETSEILQWSESKVKSTLSRAILALEKQFRKEGYSNAKEI
ncbi:RNA polymerase sigma factor [Metabacillus fastidiosus]|uniref:RNA polymerase sigma factor n=1 Tax=Metabacillus fastidiosus TaxID=1458 RepID=UPI003D2AE8B7